jgi:hypothetical protein
MNQFRIAAERRPKEAGQEGSMTPQHIQDRV